ncbi:MAG: DNA-binding response regulator [Acidobacteria bacterium]|nr:MAG: DNA-binding response regulator [Acidobacteriota bacterium]
MYKILLIDDEEQILKALETSLTKEKFQVLKANRGELGVDMAIKNNPHLVVLDWVMPGMSGVDVCRELRRKGIDVPIILLSAKSDEVDRVVGLEVGANDYVTKPFSMRELVARIRVHLRNQPVEKKDGMVRYCFGNVEIQFDTFRAWKAKEELELTPREFDIMKLLIKRRGEVVTRDRLLDEVWGYDSYPTTRTVDNHILNLRKKLEDDPANPRFILSIYGEGYKFVG